MQKSTALSNGTIHGVGYHPSRYRIENVTLKYSNLVWEMAHIIIYKSSRRFGTQFLPFNENLIVSALK